jgi:hypothetical protein
MDEEHGCVHEKDLGSIMAKQENFERWQTVQNGTLARIEEKIDVNLTDIKKEFIGNLNNNHKEFGDSLININKKFGENWANLNNKFDRINAWMYGLMGSLILSLILLALNLILKK